MVHRPRPDPVRSPLRLRPPLTPAVTVLLVAGLALHPGGPGRDLAPGDLLLVGCPVLLLVAVLVLPRLVVTDDHLDVVGVLRRHRVPWARVARVRQGWFVVLDLDGGRQVVVLAAPVVSSMVSFRTLAEDEHHLMSRESAQHAAFPGASASLAVELVGARRPHALPGPGAPSGEVRTRSRPLVCTTLAALLVVWSAAVVVASTATP